MIHYIEVIVGEQGHQKIVWIVFFLLTYCFACSNLNQDCWTVIEFCCTFEILRVYGVKKEALEIVKNWKNYCNSEVVTQWFQNLILRGKNNFDPTFQVLKHCVVLGTKLFVGTKLKSEKENWNIFSTMFDMFDDISWMIVLGEARGSRHLSRPKSRQVQDCTVNSDSWFLNTPGFKELSNFKADRYLWRVLD